MISIQARVAEIIHVVIAVEQHHLVDTQIFHILCMDHEPHDGYPAIKMLYAITFHYNNVRGLQWKIGVFFGGHILFVASDCNARIILNRYCEAQ